MALQLGQTAPDFEQDSTEGPIRFYQWLGDRWGVLFSHSGTSGMCKRGKVVLS